MMRTGHVDHMGGREKCTGFCCEIPNKEDQSDDLGVDGRLGSEWILVRLAGADGVESTGLG
jgi:hypothetical protein